jgi:hypothetical protein
MSVRITEVPAGIQTGYFPNMADALLVFIYEVSSIEDITVV